MSWRRREAEPENIERRIWLSWSWLRRLDPWKLVPLCLRTLIRKRGNNLTKNYVDVPILTLYLMGKDVSTGVVLTIVASLGTTYDLNFREWILPVLTNAVIGLFLDASNSNKEYVGFGELYSVNRNTRPEVVAHTGRDFHLFSDHFFITKAIPL
jgi:hypothetical protein